MKKVDLHIHTIASVSDNPFDFSEEKLLEYIDYAKLDCIAITNHNLFDKKQYDRILQIVTIPVFPGIEIDLEGGHLLIISDSKEDISDFCSKCDLVHAEIKSQDDYLTLEKFCSIFPDLTDYIVIPHYDKNPFLPENIRNTLKKYITAGEVSSLKKFFLHKKRTVSLVPVYFSDFRMKKEQDIHSPCQTYFDIDDDITFSKLRYCLKDKEKVYLNNDKENDFFEITDSSIKISSKLNVILGKRSTGKTHLLNVINKSLSQTDNKVLYIRQFSLLQNDNEDVKFEKLLSQNQSSLYNAYLKEFQDTVDDIKNIDTEYDENLCNEYINSLKIYATETERKDVFSKTTLFTETEFKEPDLEFLRKIFEAAKTLYDAGSYQEIIEKYIPQDTLRQLLYELLDRLKNETLKKETYKWINELVKIIKKSLSQNSSSVDIPDIDFGNIYINLKKKEKFIELVELIHNECIIQKKELHGFLIQAKREKFASASDILSNMKNRFKIQDAFEDYENGYIYLQRLKVKTEIADNDLYKYFIKIKYEVLNTYGTPVSGGERSEFNLLSELDAAEKYEFLLIDEPESSFDNLFLNNSVDSMIKDISKRIPVILVTHNNTLGLSINPDYILYTDKSIENGLPIYRIYSGAVDSHNLKSNIDEKIIKTREVLLNCLEAGEPTYNDRSHTYEILKD